MPGRMCLWRWRCNSSLRKAGRAVRIISSPLDGFYAYSNMKHCPQCTTGFPDHATTCPTHGGALNEIRELKPGMVIHKTYRIVRKLGKGGMGIVYLADQTFMEEQRALKFLSAELCGDVSFTDRFRQEVRSLRQVRHKNVVDCGDLEPAEDDSLFFSMEFVDGPNLWDFLCAAPRPFDVELALAITRSIAEGLGAAHVLGMVHRDIKPENILMTRVRDAWVPKIADFGIVASKESSSTRTRTGGTSLTMAYAAPEQWQGIRAAELDGRTDLYALGGVLFEMLIGHTVFNAENYEGWAEQHKNVTPRPPSSLRPELTNWRGLDALVIRLLAKDRHSRPKDVAEVLGLLDAVRYVPPAVIRKTEIEKTVTIRDNGSKTAKRIPGRVWVAGAALLVVAAFAAWHVFGPQPSRPSPDTSAQAVPAGNPPSVKPQNQVEAPKRSGEKSVIPQKPTPEQIDNPKPPHEKPGVAQEPKPAVVEIVKPPVQSESIADVEKRAVTFYKHKTYEDAAVLFDQACTGGNLDGCNYLGFMYQHQQGVTQDYAHSVALYTKACDGDNLEGCNNLGYMYQLKQGVAQDDAHAAALYTKSCAGGSAHGCNNLGHLYHEGVGVPRDDSRAVELLTKACDSGLSGGCNDLGVLYATGVNGAKDDSLAAVLFAKACDGGNAQGCNELGNSYRYGRGVKTDSAKARSLLNKGCSMGAQSGCDQLKGMQ